jgi:hypothetical protein
MINAKKFLKIRVILRFWKIILIYAARFVINMLEREETFEHLYLELLRTLMPVIFT